MKIKTAELEISAAGKSQFPDSGLPELAVIGRSNVGKSSLINKLLARRQLARTSGTPGKTRLLNFYLINASWYLVDLPGYGYARVARTERQRWQQLLAEYLGQRQSLRGIVMAVDLRHLPSKEDIQFFQWLQRWQRPLLLVATKADKISRGRQGQHLAEIAGCLGVPPQSMLPISSKTGQGITELQAAIADMLDAAPTPRIDNPGAAHYNSS